jgi:transcriptional regulator with XRE-family HTH domain
MGLCRTEDRSQIDLADLRFLGISPLTQIAHAVENIASADIGQAYSAKAEVEIYRHAPLRFHSPGGQNCAVPKKRKKKKLNRTFVREWRKHRHLTQVQLAERVGIAQGSLSDLERGDFAYTQPMLEALADALNCRPWDLIWRPPGAEDALREVLEGMDADQQKQALAVVQALRANKAA